MNEIKKKTKIFKVPKLLSGRLGKSDAYEVNVFNETKVSDEHFEFYFLTHNFPARKMSRAEENYIIEYAGDDQSIDLFIRCISAFPKSLSMSLIDGYMSKAGAGYNGANFWFSRESNDLLFVDLYDLEQAQLSQNLTNDLFKLYNQNYYWYMQSLPDKYHPEWYEEFVDTFAKYYPNEKIEIDEREKIDVNDLIDSYESLVDESD